MSSHFPKAGLCCGVRVLVGVLVGGSWGHHRYRYLCCFIHLNVVLATNEVDHCRVAVPPSRTKATFALFTHTLLSRPPLTDSLNSTHFIPPSLDAIGILATYGLRTESP